MALASPEDICLSRRPSPGGGSRRSCGLRMGGVEQWSCNLASPCAARLPRITALRPMTASSDRVSPPSKSAERGSTRLDARIRKLGAAYLQSPSPQTASDFASLVYPLAFRAVFDVGGSFDEVSGSTLAAVRAVFEDLERLCAEPRPTASIARLASVVASKRSLAQHRESLSQAASRVAPEAGGDSPSRAETALGSDPREAREAGSVPVPNPLSDSAHRGIALLKKAAASPSARVSVAPAVREAIDSLPAPLRVALRLCLVSSLPLSELQRELFPAQNGGGDDTAHLASLISEAAISVFERLGEVVDDE